MKKFIICLLLFSFSFIALPSLAQSDSTKVADTTTERIIDKLSNNMSSAVTTIAQSLKTPAEHVYKVLVKQQLIYSLQILMSMILLSVIGMMLLYNGYKKWGIAKNNKDYYNDFDDGQWCGIIIAGYLFIGASIITFLAGFGDMIGGFINPEYGAIQDILKIFK